VCKNYKQLWFRFWWINYSPPPFHCHCRVCAAKHPQTRIGQKTDACNDVGPRYQIMYFRDASGPSAKNSDTRRVRSEHKKLNVLHLLYILSAVQRKKHVLKSKLSRPIAVGILFWSMQSRSVCRKKFDFVDPFSVRQLFPTVIILLIIILHKLKFLFAGVVKPGVLQGGG